jgi:hypothetical protein
MELQIWRPKTLPQMKVRMEQLGSHWTEFYEF